MTHRKCAAVATLAAAFAGMLSAVADAATVSIFTPTGGNFIPGSTISVQGNAFWNPSGFSSVDTVTVIVRHMPSGTITDSTGTGVVKNPNPGSGTWNTFGDPSFIATRASGHATGHQYLLEAEGHNAAVGPFTPPARASVNITMN